jgi:two-component system, chemotaxis family, CheB/CheR fusion protein
MSETQKLCRTLGGPLLILLAVVGMEVLRRAGIDPPNPGLVLLPVVVISTLSGRMGAGLSAAVLSCLYYLYFHHVPGTAWFGQLVPQAWTAIAATILVVPLTEIMRRRLMGETEERFQTMADNVAQLAWMADARGEIFWYNRRWYDYTGTTPDEIHHMDWTSLHHPEHVERVASRLRRCLEAGEEWEDTFPLRSGDGTFRWFLSRAIPVRDRKGRVIRWFGTHTDITGEREIEQELSELNQNLESRVVERTAQLRRMALELTDAEQRERRRLAQVLHDDLQQLLVAARMKVSLLTRPGSAPQQAQSLDELLGKAIEATRMLSRELAPAVLYDKGLGAALHWLGGIAEQRYGLHVEVNVEESGEPEAERWRVLLFEAVRELLLNVAKHAGTDRVQITLKRADGQLQLDVDDEGCGFDLAVARAGGGNTAGGMFSLEQRLNLMGGEVKIESAPGSGTRVRMKMQVASPSPLNGKGAETAP